MTLNISKTLHNRDPQGQPDVRAVQNRLVARGFYVGRTGADGIFGDDTDAAVRRFQAKYALTRDGVVGPKTWQMLSASTSRPSAPTSSAFKFADLAYRLVTHGIDGTKPRYVFGSEANLSDPSPDRLDCSELVQWAVYQITKNAWIDGSRYQYAGSHHISVAEGIRTKGALLFLSGTGNTNGIHHVVISMGNGKTAEARSTNSGCGSWPATGRGFQYAAKIPVLHY